MLASITVCGAEGDKNQRQRLQEQLQHSYVIFAFLLAHRTNILMRDVATGRDKAQLTSVTVRTVMSGQTDLLVSMCMRYVI